MVVPDDRAESIGRLLDSVLDALRHGGDLAEPLGRMCQWCIETLHVDGATVSVTAGTQHRETICASDTLAKRIESVQFDLGEGPGIDAERTGRPVLAPDLSERHQSWPMFTAAVEREHVAAVFVFPLQRGAAQLGALTMYRRERGWLSEDDLSAALQAVDIAGNVLVAAAVNPEGAIKTAWLTELTKERAVVHQATGMVVAELDVNAAEALGRLRAYAYLTGRSVQDVAEDMVQRRLHPGVINE